MVMAEGRRRNKAARAKAFDDEWLRLTEEARIGFDDEEHVTSRRCSNNCAKTTRQRARFYWPRSVDATRHRAKGFDDAFLRLKEEARIAFDDEERCNRRHLAALIDGLRHCQEAAAQAAESAVLLLAKERRRHEAPELATPMRSLGASRDRTNIKAIAYEAPALPTTTSPAPPAMLSPSPCPTSSYLGAVLNTNGGGHSLSHSMSPTVAAPTSLYVIKD
jgi:hypothetical protein